MARRAAARTRLESLSPSAIHILFVGGAANTKDKTNGNNRNMLKLWRPRPSPRFMGSDDPADTNVLVLRGESAKRSRPGDPYGSL
jgi:hypothetical protein